MTPLRQALLGGLVAALATQAWAIPLDIGHIATIDSRTDEDASAFQKAIAQGKLVYNTMQGHAIPIDHKPAPMTREQVQTDLESQGWKLMDDPNSAHILQVAEARANAPVWDMLNSDCLTPVLIAMASRTQPKEFMPTVYWHNDTMINKHWSLPSEEVVFEFRNGTLPEGLDGDWERLVALDYWGKYDGSKLGSFVECDVPEDEFFEALKAQASISDFDFPGKTFKAGEDGFYGLLGLSSGRAAANLMNNGGEIKAGEKCVDEIQVWEPKSGAVNVWYKFKEGSCDGDDDEGGKLVRRVGGESSRQGQASGSADGTYFNAAVQEGLQIQQQISGGAYNTITQPPSPAEIRKYNWNDYSKAPESNGGPKPFDEQADIIQNCIMPPGKAISSGFDGRSLIVKKYVHAPSGAYFENWYESGMIFSIDNSSPSARQKSGHYKGALPPLRYWNQFAYLDYYKFIGFSDLEAVVHCNVMEDKTRRLVRDIRARRHLEAGKAIKFGQMYFPQKSYEFAALLTTPAAKGTLELLALIPRKEGRFEITSITLWTNEHGTTNLAFGIGRLSAGAGKGSSGSSGRTGKRDEVAVLDARNAPLSQVAENVVSKGRSLYKQMLTPGPGTRPDPGRYPHTMDRFAWEHIEDPRPMTPSASRVIKESWQYLQATSTFAKNIKYREPKRLLYHTYLATSDNLYDAGSIWMLQNDPATKHSTQTSDMVARIYTSWSTQPLEHIVSVNFEDISFRTALPELVPDVRQRTFANKLVATPERNGEVFFTCLGTADGPLITQMLWENRKKLGHRCVVEVTMWVGEKDMPSVYYRLGDCPSSSSTTQRDSPQRDSLQKDMLKGSIAGGNTASQGLRENGKVKVERRQIASALDEVDAHESRSAPLSQVDKAAIAKGRKLYRQMMEPGVGEPSTWTHLSLDDMKLHGWKKMRAIPPDTGSASVMREIAKYLRLPSFPNFGTSSTVFRQVKYMDGVDMSDNVYGPGIIFTINNDFSKHSSLNFSDIVHLAYANTQGPQPLKHIVSVNIEDLYFHNILHKLVIPKEIPFAKKRIATPQQNSDIFFACLGAAEGPQIAQMLLQYRKSFGHKCVVKIMLWTDEDEIPSIYYKLGDCPMPGISRGGTPRTRKKPLPEGSSRGDSPARPHIDHAAEDRGSRTDTKRNVERDKIPWQRLSSNPDDRDGPAKRFSSEQAIETGKKMQKKLDAKVSVKAASFQFKDLALWGWSATTNVTLNTNALPNKNIENVRSQIYGNEASKAGIMTHITWTHDKDTRNRRATGAFYENFYDPRIIVVKGDKTPQEAGAEHNPVIDRFPAIKSWATVTWLQYSQLYKSPAHKNFSAVLQLDVSNKESLPLIKHIFKDLEKKPSFPGTAIKYGTPAFYTLLGIPNGQMVVSLLAQHKEQAFGQKCIQQVNVWWNGDLPTLWYQIQNAPCDGVLAPGDSIVKHLRIGVPKYHVAVPEESEGGGRHMGDP